ncbi:hypothetical protein IAE35_22940 [Pseudomonas sp. S75]|uniref:hypothetical protein n=1 Tax=unclassified Pseudomonas TaxID=196821 RepID=UPI001902E091|nr:MULTISPECIES: hypothetical protein [unclassified Pseudomonas]MBJ9977213.1 hypothetical protein [Pseudomonas sp. S30]MBK0156208.1 hypothetical protein [Pseudomonas sp. S75]
MKLIHKVGALVALPLSMLSSGAMADGTKGVQELLKLGYEIKGAYQAPGPGGRRIAHYLILQKGSSAYQCSNVSNGATLYSNTYSCDDIVDLKE